VSLHSPSSSDSRSSLSKFLTKSSPLLDIASDTFRERNRFSFYTDGLVVIDSSSSNNSGIGWVETFKAPHVTFKAQIKGKYSSIYDVELQSIITALLAVPAYSSIDIHTDSSSTVSDFNRIALLNRTKHTRTISRIANHVLWIIIFDIIDYNDLEVNLFKVQSHSNNHFNNLADSLAKEGRSAEVISINLSSNSHFGHILKYDQHYLQTDLRKLIKHIFHAKRFMSFYNLNRFARHTNQHINWTATFATL
jgi:ribonuclease HI